MKRELSKKLMTLAGINIVRARAFLISFLRNRFFVVGYYQFSIKLNLYDTI